MPAETNTKKNPYFDVPFLPLENQDQDSRHGAHFFRNVKQLQVGFGSKVFRVDRDGMWAGAEEFASAPFKVDWDGNIIASSITLSGYIPTGGALNDIGAGNITSTYIGSNAVTTGKIAANAVTATQIAANAVTATKISVSQLSAISADVGTITAGTITGVVLRTDTSGERIVIDGDDNDITIYDTGGDRRARGYDQGWEYYNESGTLVGELYASNSLGFLIAGDLVSGGDVYYGAGSSGAHSFHIGTSNSLRLFIDTNDIFIGDTNNLSCDIELLGDVTCHNGIKVDGDINMNGDGNIDFGIWDGFLTLSNMSGSTASSIGGDSDGSMYYRTDDDVIRVKLNGTWKTITTS